MNANHIIHSVSLSILTSTKVHEKRMCSDKFFGPKNAINDMLYL